MTTSSYQDIYNELVKLTQLQTFTEFQKKALLFHAVLIKNNNKPLLPYDKENFQSNSSVFTYEYPPSVIISLKLKYESDTNKISIDSTDYKQDKIKMKLSCDSSSLKGIDYTNLNTTIIGLEKYLQENFIPKITEQYSSMPNNTKQQNSYQDFNSEFKLNDIYKNNLNTNTYSTSSSYNYMSGNFNNPEMNYNPFFSTGGTGGLTGGNLVGPNSDVFNFQQQNPYNNPYYGDPSFFNPNINPNFPMYPFPGF